MLRIFCSTDRCGFQAAQLEAAQAAIADLRARCDALLAERDAAQAENERLRDACACSAVQSHRNRRPESHVHDSQRHSVPLRS